MDLFLSLHFMVNCILRLQFVQENSFFFHFHGRFGSILPERKRKTLFFLLSGSILPDKNTNLFMSGCILPNTRVIF